MRLSAAGGDDVYMQLFPGLGLLVWQMVTSKNGRGGQERY